MDSHTLIFDMDCLACLCVGQDVTFYSENGDDLPITIQFDPQVIAAVRKAFEMMVIHGLPTVPGVH